MGPGLILIRHAQSTFNASDPAIDGEWFVDCPLTAYGREQAGALNDSCDLILLSPLRRTRETYENSAISAKEVIVSPLVREVRIDCCDFLEGEERVPETEEELSARIDEAHRLLMFLSRHRKIVVVTHRDFIIEFLKRKFSIERKSIDNCERICLEV
ncbi:MAG: phosphoglycerate mutase family protein [Sulfobacillus sp.]